MDTNHLTDFINSLTNFLKNEVKTDTIIGNQFKLGEFTCVPVMSIGMGFGAGGGEGTDEKKQSGTGAGGGAGVGLAPIGFLATYKDQIQFISTQHAKGLGSVFERIPDLMEKYMDKKNQEKEAVKA